MSPTQVIRVELESIRKIEADETWIEGERRGCPVPERDHIVQARVADILLNGVGAELRKKLQSVD